MQKEKRVLKYYFSTEGETEKWYLEKLSNLINNDKSATHKVSFVIKVDSSSGFMKRTPFIKEVRFFHFFDVESTTPEYEKRFIGVLDNMRSVEKQNKNISYIPIYSNLTFELWMILHKIDCNGSLADRKHYFPLINKAFNVNYQGLKEYKEEKHFKNILANITINDVKAAIDRADKIMTYNRTHYNKKQKYNYSWYDENPATEVGTIIKEILTNCGLFP